MNHISLFSGIGGIDIAAEWAGFKTICFVENNPYCQKVLKKHWPDVPIIGDVKDVTKEQIDTLCKCVGWEKGSRESIQPRKQVAEGQDTRNLCTESITLISGGFPCQPHSVAGKRKGSTDERNLWPEFRRVIGEIKPRWVLAENVPGLFSSDDGRFFGTILNDLAEMGYSTGWATYGAVDVGALHRRNRVFIVAYSQQQGLEVRGVQPGDMGEQQSTTERGSQDVADTTGKGLERRKLYFTSRAGSSEFNDSSWWAVEPELGRVAHGIPSRVDRLKAIGNAVVPQQIYPILKAIADIEEG